MACVHGLFGADNSVRNHQRIDNRLQCTHCTVSWKGMNGFDKKFLVSRDCQKEGKFLRINLKVIDERPGLVKHIYTPLWIVLNGWLAWFNEVIKERSGLIKDRIWLLVQRPGLIKDRYALVFAWVLFAKANSSLKPNIRPGWMSGAVSGETLVTNQHNIFCNWNPLPSLKILILMIIRSEWKNKKLDIWNIRPTKSCPMVSTKKILKTFSEILLSSVLYRGLKFKKIWFFEENACFTAPTFYIQLLDCHTIYHWKELFKRKRMTYYLSICFYLVKLLNFKHFPCFATCREDKNG